MADTRDSARKEYVRVLILRRAVRDQRLGRALRLFRHFTQLNQLILAHDNLLVSSGWSSLHAIGRGASETASSVLGRQGQNFRKGASGIARATKRRVATKGMRESNTHSTVCG